MHGDDVERVSRGNFKGRNFVMCLFQSLSVAFIVRLFNSQPIVYFFHYVAVFPHRVSMAYIIFLWKWIGGICVIELWESQASFFFLFCIENTENHHWKYFVLVYFSFNVKTNTFGSSRWPFLYNNWIKSYGSRYVWREEHTWGWSWDWWVRMWFANTLKLNSGNEGKRKFLWLLSLSWWMPKHIFVKKLLLNELKLFSVVQWHSTLSLFLHFLERK